MSNLDSINDNFPAAGSENKHVRRSPRLQGTYEQKGQVDNLPIESQPDPTEALDVGPPTSVVHIPKTILVTIVYSSKFYQY